MTLAVCPDCSRHVRPDAPCPFCGSAGPRTPRTVAVLPNASRAMIFAGAVALSGCCMTLYGGPPVEDEEPVLRQAQDERVEPAPVPEPVDVQPEPAPAEPEPDPAAQAPMYGGPPADVIV
jgi:hypothetical protein